MNPNILTLDIENAPHEAYVWGYYEQNVVKIIRYSYILMVGVKRSTEKRARVLTLLTHPGKHKRDDSVLMRAIREELDWADIVITQNGKKFDIKKLNTQFIKHKISPPSPFKLVDTKQDSSRHFYFANNKLDNLGEELGFGGKMQHEGFPLWEGVMALDPKATKKMADYCKRDVELTEQIYLAERPYVSGHPNINAYTGLDNCRLCQSPNLNWRGYNTTQTGKTPRYQCKDCGTWGQSSKSIKVTNTK